MRIGDRWIDRVSRGPVRSDERERERTEVEGAEHTQRQSKSSRVESACM